MTKGNQGISSKNVRHVTAPKVEPRPHARNPARVAQYGELVGNHTTARGGGKTSYRGDPDFTRAGYSPPQGPTSFSNVGPGGGRKVYGSGSQSQHGQPAAGNPRPAGRDILSQFGPDKRSY